MSQAEDEFTQQVQQAAQQQAETIKKILEEQAKKQGNQQVDVIKESMNVVKMIKDVSKLTGFSPEELAQLSKAMAKLQMFLSTLTTQNTAQKAINKFVDQVGKRSAKEAENQQVLPLGNNSDPKTKTKFLEETEKQIEKWLDTYKDT